MRTTRSLMRRAVAASSILVGALLVAGCSDSKSDTTIQAKGSWVATGSLTLPRTFFTTTVLQSGQVLVAGGEVDLSGAEWATSTAERYDPATGAWSAAASMAARRGSPCAVRLASGKVLVVGGYNSADWLATAELYDPAGNTWTPTAGPMTEPRVAPGCTLLQSGKVLVSGGMSADGVASSATADIFDPATGLFAATGPMATGRSIHTVTLLDSGKVLLVGGVPSWSSSTAIASAEIYDPATELWTSAGTLPSTLGVTGHTATLLPTGKVLVAGGCQAVSMCTDALMRGTFLYDPMGGGWTSAGSMTRGRVRHAAILLTSGDVLIAGGTEFTGFPKTTDRYDLVAGSWAAGPASLFDHGVGVGATLLPGGKGLVVGGRVSGDLPSAQQTGAAEIFTE